MKNINNSSVESVIRSNILNEFEGRIDMNKKTNKVKFTQLELNMLRSASLSDCGMVYSEESIHYITDALFDFIMSDDFDEVLGIVLNNTNFIKVGGYCIETSGFDWEEAFVEYNNIGSDFIKFALRYYDCEEIIEDDTFIELFTEFLIAAMKSLLVFFGDIIDCSFEGDNVFTFDPCDDSYDKGIPFSLGAVDNGTEFQIE